MQLYITGGGFVRQSRRHSFLESTANTTVGYFVNLGVQMVVFPLFGMHISLAENVGIGAIFTVVSIARGYILRRIYEVYLR